MFSIGGLLYFLLDRIKIFGIKKFFKGHINPSQIFFIVETVGFAFSLTKILFSVDCVIPQIVESLFIVICRWSHSSRMRVLIASVSTMLFS